MEEKEDLVDLIEEDPWTGEWGEFKVQRDYAEKVEEADL